MEAVISSGGCSSHSGDSDIGALVSLGMSLHSQAYEIFFLVQGLYFC